MRIAGLWLLLAAAAAGQGPREGLGPQGVDPPAWPQVGYNRSRGLRGQARADRVITNAFHPEGGVLGRQEVFEFELPDPLHPLYNELLTFEVAGRDVRALEVVVLISHGWEAYVGSSVRTGFPRIASNFTADNPEIASGGYDPTEYRRVADAKCYHIFDECVAQRYSQYTTPPHVPPGTMYGNRLAYRVDHHYPLDIFSTSMDGKWTIEIANRLPGGVTSAHVKVILIQRFSPYWRLFATIVSIIMAFVALGSCLVRWENEALAMHIRGEGPPAEELSLEERLKRCAAAVQNFAARAWARARRRGGGEGGSGEAGPEGEPAAAAGDDEDTEDEEMCCRICRSTHPKADLFSPCACSGSVKYIHRACLEEWRAITTKPENKVRCSECKHPFTLQVQCTHKPLRYSYEKSASWARFALKIVLCELALIAIGYVFKVVMFVASPSGGIVWTVDLYHHFVALHIVHAYQLRLRCFQGTFGLLFPNPVVREAVRVASLVLEVPLGYVGNYIYWLMVGCLWDWQVHYCKGALMTLFFTVGVNYTRYYQIRTRARREVEEAAIGRARTPQDAEEGGQRDEAAPAPTAEDAQGDAPGSPAGPPDSPPSADSGSDSRPPTPVPPPPGPPPRLSNPPSSLD